jgi:hypothetical protein
MGPAEPDQVISIHPVRLPDLAWLGRKDIPRQRRQVRTIAVLVYLIVWEFLGIGMDRSVLVIAVQVRVLAQRAGRISIAIFVRIGAFRAGVLMGAVRFVLIARIVGAVIPIVARIPRVVALIPLLVAHLLPIAEQPVRWAWRFAGLTESLYTIRLPGAEEPVLAVTEVDAWSR